jgi:hypothetical protein
MEKETAKEFINRKNVQFEKEKDSFINMKDIGREGKMHFIREAWTFLPQSNLKDKVFIFERLRKEKFSGKLSYQKNWKKNDIEYRIGYYIVGKIRKANNRWIWGQFCPIIPHKDLIKLLNKAKKEKTIL